MLSAIATGVECLDLTGEHVSRTPNFFRVEVATAKNHPEGFSVRIPVDATRPNCVGTFFADYIKVTQSRSLRASLPSYAGS
jgi:hypothetical protein